MIKIVITFYNVSRFKGIKIDRHTLDDWGFWWHCLVVGIAHPTPFDLV
ncbi:hypothetical protein [Spirulina major]|nr:hypothetical protein [Spirulina major]